MATYYSTGTLSIGAAVLGGTAGSVLYLGAGPVLAQDNTNLLYDSVNTQLRARRFTAGTDMGVGSNLEAGNFASTYTTAQIDASNPNCLESHAIWNDSVGSPTGVIRGMYAQSRLDRAAAFNGTCNAFLAEALTNAATTALQVVGIGGTANAQTGGTITAAIGIQGGSYTLAPGDTITDGACIEGIGGTYTGGAVGSMSSIRAKLDAFGGTITNYYAFKHEVASFAGGAVITNYYGLYLPSITGASTLNYAIYSAGGQSFHSGNFTFGSNVSVSSGQVNCNTFATVTPAATMVFASTGGAFTFDGPVSLATSASVHIDSIDGTSAAVSAANHGRIRYNDTTKTWQVSMDTSAYASIATGSAGGTLDNAYDFGGVGSGRTITVDGGPVQFSGSGTPGTIGTFLVDGSQTIASGAAAVWKAISFVPNVTVSGSTNIATAAGFNMIEIAGPTVTAGSALTITSAATLTILDAPTGAGAGPATITNKYALWVQAGATMLPAGTAPLPALCFAGEKTTGFYRVAADTIGISLAGNLAVRLAANTFQMNSSATGQVLTFFDNNVGRLMRGEPASNGNDGILTLGTDKVQMSLCTSTNSYGSGKGVILVGNANTNPTGNPTGGGLMYSNAGAGTWRGSGGTITAFGPAGPHCIKCGYDEWTVATMNTTWKSWRFVCGHCGSVYSGGPQNVHDHLDNYQKHEYLKSDMSFEEVSKLMKVG